MNPLAKELNDKLKNSVAIRLFSEYGKKIYFPSKGIVAQAAQAKEAATRYDATVGMACYKQKPIRTKQIEMFTNALTEEESVAYAPTAGIKQLRVLWQKEIIRKNPNLQSEKISLPIVVPGLTAGIAQIAELFFDEESTLVIPNMFWGNYRLIFEGKRESKIALFPFFNEQGGMDLAAYKEALIANATEGKIRTLLNFPNNPTGYSPSCKEVKEIRQIFLDLAELGYDLLAIVDDAYFGLFYEEETFKQSLFSVLANLHPNILAVKVDGATKEHFVWGFRVGFVTFGSLNMQAEEYFALEQKLAGSLRASLSNCSTIGQNIMIAALNNPEYEKERLSYDKKLESRYHIVKKLVSNLPSDFPLKPLPFNSGYFMTFKVNGNAEQLRLALLSQEGIGSISINETFLRIVFSAVDEENIEDLYNRIFECAKQVIG